MAFAYGGDIGVHSYLNIEAFANRSGIPHSIVSDFRPGSITLTGNVSYHAKGNAVDFGSSARNMVSFASWCMQFSAYTLELIHAGGGGFYVHNGVRGYKYSSAIVAQHWNHVHWAITNSGLQAASTVKTSAGGVLTSISLPVGNIQPARGCLVPAMVIVSGIGGVGWMTVELLHRWVSGLG